LQRSLRVRGIADHQRDALLGARGRRQNEQQRRDRGDARE
jgi:hypothetical protein